VNADLVSRILKVETILAIAAAVFLTASLVPSRKAHFSPEQAAWSDSGVQDGKPSPFPASRPKVSASHRNTVSEIPPALPVMQTPVNYLQDSIPSPELH
jgi:hypothetical protein